MLTLRPLSPPSLPIEALGLLATPFGSLDELRRFELTVGNQPKQVSEVFEVSGKLTVDSRWRFEGDLSSVHHLGEGMTGGEVVVAGNIGRHCGARMTGGQITVEGDAGDWLGAEMRAGTITLQGSAGDNVGAAYRGDKLGMKGGTIIIHGDAGDELGQSMRRGLILVAGRCGGLAGYRMRAGTIAVLGDCGPRPGLDMLRGTLGLFGPGRPALPCSFRPACRLTPPVLPLLRRQAAEAGGGCFQAIPAEVTLYNGDLLRGGRGEVFVR